MQAFTDLQVWQEAHKLTLLVYGLTKSWPRDEMFGLISQVRRSASSVGSNIAEGHGRLSHSEFHHFCNIARGSLYETRNHLLVARDLGYLQHGSWCQADEQAASVSRLLNGFMKSLRSE